MCDARFTKLPASWRALSGLRELRLLNPGALNAARALEPLGSWTQLTSLHVVGTGVPFTPLQQQLTRLSALQEFRIAEYPDFELPPGHWQGQLTSLECDLSHVLVLWARSTQAAAVLAHATALRRLEAHSVRMPRTYREFEENPHDYYGSYYDEDEWGDEGAHEDEIVFPQPNLRALLGALAALPALQRATLRNTRLQHDIWQAHTALSSPLGARLQYSEHEWWHAGW